MLDRLIIVAPEEMRSTLLPPLQRVSSNVLFSPRPEAVGPCPDPYCVTELTLKLNRKPSALLLVAPRRRAPGRLVPSAVVNGVPVGLVQADTPSQLDRWLNAIAESACKGTPTQWAVMAMNKKFYLDWGHRWATWMRTVEAEGRVNAKSWLADTTTREELCQLLANGPALAIYCGHGRARGWSGYRALRWHHIAQETQNKPCGTVVGLSCDTLKRSRGLVPFGCLWINEGRSGAYLGSVARLGVKANDAFARVLGTQLATGKYNTIGALLVAVDSYLTVNPELREARKGFNTYRLMGNPLQRLY